MEPEKIKDFLHGHAEILSECSKDIRPMIEAGDFPIKTKIQMAAGGLVELQTATGHRIAHICVDDGVYNPITLTYAKLIERLLNAYAEKVVADRSAPPEGGMSSNA